jgi:hypothetical protein
MDHEANFLLQIRGTKAISVWDPTDRAVVAERELEAFHGAWSLDETILRDELEPRARVIDAAPGTGVFMPFTAPHAVRNGPEISVTLSVTFITNRMRREQALFSANHRLRKLGISPRAVGSSRVHDAAKLGVFGALDGARGLLRGGMKSGQGARY